MKCKIILQDIFSENVMEPTVLLVLSMSFMVLRFSVLDKSYIGVFVWLVMIINAAMFVILISGIFYRLLGPRSTRQPNDCANMNQLGSANSRSGTNEVDQGEQEEGERRHLLLAEGGDGYVLQLREGYRSNFMFSGNVELECAY